MLKKSHSQHIQKGRMTQVLCVENELYVCCCRLLRSVENVLFLRVWDVELFFFFYFPFFNCLSMLSMLPVVYFIFSVTSLKKACTIIKLISAQFKTSFLLGV